MCIHGRQVGIRKKVRQSKDRPVIEPEAGMRQCQFGHAAYVCTSRLAHRFPYLRPAWDAETVTCLLSCLEWSRPTLSPVLFSDMFPDALFKYFKYRAFRFSQSLLRGSFVSITIIY